MSLTYISTPLDITTSDTAVSVANITSDIDSTYNEYQLHFVNIHPETDNVKFIFNASFTYYNLGIASTSVQARLREYGDLGQVAYDTADDSAGASNAALTQGAANDADASVSGILTLYDPSSTTYYKHFSSRISEAGVLSSNDAMHDCLTSGYIMTASAITTLSFSFSSGNITAGTIHMYGVG